MNKQRIMKLTMKKNIIKKNKIQSLCMGKFFFQIFSIKIKFLSKEKVAKKYD